MEISKEQGIKIELFNCAKTYNNSVRALEPLNLQIQAGETVVLLGPSGCGKTTMLRIIAGLEEIDKGGKVLFDGLDVTKLPIEKRNVGMVFQSYALFPNMNVWDNIAYGLKVRKMKREEIEQRVDEMLAMMSITNLANRKITELSGGQRQRVALARAIATRPKILLLDEPLSALDASLRNNLRVEIDTLLKKLKITAVYVTHDQSEAMALGDRIVVMQNGKVSQIGTPTKLYHYPKNNFVAEFIGTINRFSGDYKDKKVTIDNYTFDTETFFDDGQIDVLFRPEDVIIAKDEQAPFKGIITGNLFLGEKVRLVLDVGKNREVIVETNNRDVYKMGEMVRFYVDKKSFILMPREETK